MTPFSSKPLVYVLTTLTLGWLTGSSIIGETIGAAALTWFIL
jgi:hypothetical protein